MDDIMHTLLGETEKQFLNGEIKQEDYISRREEILKKGYKAGIIRNMRLTGMRLTNMRMRSSRIILTKQRQIRSL